MTRTQSAFAIGGFMVGASLLARELRSRRAIDLQDRVVLITGGSRGLGLLMAREVGRLGARVVLVARDEAELQRAQQNLTSHGVEATILVADVAAESEARQLVEEAVARHGRLDVLINNAGVITVGPFDHMTMADFEQAMATHFWGPLHTMFAAIPHMRREGGGRIVNISSIGGRIGVPHLAPYCASKFALTGVSTALRAELSRYGILVTTVCPGPDADGIADQRLVQRTLPRGVRVVRHRRLAASAVDRRSPGRSTNRRRHAPWRRRARGVVAGQAGDRCRCSRTEHRRQAIDPRQPGAPLAHGDFGNESHSGWHSRSRWAPSVLTRTTDRSAAENNELP